MHAPRFALSAVLLASASILSACTTPAPKNRLAPFADVGINVSNLEGGDFGGTKAAAGFDVSAGVVRGPWQLGLGYDRANHGHEDSNGDFVVSNLYLEPQFHFVSATRRFTPYIAGRVGKAMASFDESYGGTSDADGWIYGLGAGVLWPLAKSVQVDGALHYARVSHDYGSGDYSDSEKGNLISMRAGIRIFR
jgi:hypothetical protein